MASTKNRDDATECRDDIGLEGERYINRPLEMCFLEPRGLRVVDGKIRPNPPANRIYGKILDTKGGTVHKRKRNAVPSDVKLGPAVCSFCVTRTGGLTLKGGSMVAFSGRVLASGSWQRG